MISNINFKFNAGFSLFLVSQITLYEDYGLKLAIVVSQDTAPRQIKISEEQSILVLPWQHLLEKLWRGELT